MAPEMFEGGPLTPAVDQWAFGALLYEMAAGEAPWAGLATPMQAGEGWMGWVGWVGGDVEGVRVEVVGGPRGGRVSEAGHGRAPCPARPRWPWAR